MSGRADLLAGATLFELEPSEIETGDRIGFLHTDKAAALGRLMAVDGQRDPIKVVKNRKAATRPWRLVTGMHRTHGAELEGIRVWAIEVSGKPEDLAELEASENLHRRPLGPIERAKFTAALAQAARERIARARGDLKQQQIAVKARWARVKSGEVRAEQALQEEAEDTQCQFGTAYSWEESVGAALDLARRDIYRDLKLYRLLIEPFPDLIEALARHPLVGETASQLNVITSLHGEEARRAVIEALLANHGLNAVDACLSAGVSPKDGPTPLEHEKHVSAVKGGLSRLNATLQKRHLPDFILQLKTDEVKRQLRDLLNEELGDAKVPVNVDKPVPAVAVRASVRLEYIVCLDCGEQHQQLKRHLRSAHGLQPGQYIAKWGLPTDYPLVAPNYAEERRRQAMKLGLKGETDA